jgi:cytoplasmic FMR1 interacting protein
VLLKQRHIRLLGRHIDLNHLISQRMNTYLRQNVDYAISRFEASDITSVMELESLLATIRLAYTLMSKYFEVVGGACWLCLTPANSLTLGTPSSTK